MSAVAIYDNKYLSTYTESAATGSPAKTAPGPAAKGPLSSATNTATAAANTALASLVEGYRYENYSAWFSSEKFALYIPSLNIHINPSAHQTQLIQREGPRLSKQLSEHVFNTLSKKNLNAWARHDEMEKLIEQSKTLGYDPVTLPQDLVTKTEALLAKKIALQKEMDAIDEQMKKLASTMVKGAQPAATTSSKDLKQNH